MKAEMSVFEIEKLVNDSARSGDDPALAEAMLDYVRATRGQPFLTIHELKSLFISYNGISQGRGESQRYPLSEADKRAFERLREISGISTNSLEMVVRTHGRASPELIAGQKERALGRQAADLISRLDKDNTWLQGRLVQLYFERGLEIKDLADLVRQLSEHRNRERQEGILRQAGEVSEYSSEVSRAPTVTSALGSLVEILGTNPVDTLSDDELTASLPLLKRAIVACQEYQRGCLAEVQDRYSA
jgi:hypothetical protein